MGRVKIYYIKKSLLITVFSVPIVLCIKLCLSGASSVEVERLRNTNSCPFCNLRGANLGSANLIGANLFHANLRGANLTNAKLMHSYLNSADLTKAKLKRADLTYADLSSTHLSAANLEGANLQEANLVGARNLTIEQLSNVKTLYQAKLDDELMEQVKEKYPHLLEKPK
jgi:uncharacterized protein YjbI with pentapeptide repeats